MKYKVLTCKHLLTYCLAMKTSSRGRSGERNRRDPFFAILDPTRRRLLDVLARGERPVKRLAASFSTTRSAISQHLRVLHAAGLVSERHAGREHLYQLRPGRLREVYEWVARYERFWRS